MKDNWWTVPAALAVVGVFALGITIGGALESTKRPTNYANGYCAALGGERLNDETCNVDGKVVVIP